MPLRAARSGAIQSGWRLALREFVRNRLAVVGVAILLFFVVFCFLGPLFYHGNTLQANLINAHDPPGRRAPARHRHQRLRRPRPSS